MANNYTDIVTNAFIQGAAGINPGKATNLAALEVAAGLYGRAFAMADVTPKTALTKSLTATILASIGREIIRRGEAVYFIERRGDTAVLTPSSFWNVFGTSSDPMEWLYHVDLPVPSGSRHVQIKGDRIIHSMYARDNFRPWRGLSPLQYASLTGDLGAAIETSLKQEESGPVANILPIPDSGKATGADGEEIDKTGEFKEHLEQAKGDTVLARSTSGAWDKGNYSKPSGDYVPTRLGPNPPAGSVSLRDGVSTTILAACGVPIELAHPSDGGSMRESWRRFLLSSVQPLADVLAEELSIKFEEDISLTFTRLHAADSEGRGRALRSMVDAGMELEKAVVLSGLLLPGEEN